MDSFKVLGKLQFEIMHVLWKEGKATSAEIHRALSKTRNLAPTTVATVLRRLDQSGCVAHDTDGRQFVYRAELQRKDVQRSVVSDLVTSLFRGDPGALVNCLLSESEIDAKDLDDISALIEEAKRRKPE